MSNLLCSAESKEDLEKLINEYFFSTNYQIRKDGKIYNKLKDTVLINYRVIQKKGRWRFEQT